MLIYITVGLSVHMCVLYVCVCEGVCMYVWVCGCVLYVCVICDVCVCVCEFMYNTIIIKKEIQLSAFDNDIYKEKVQYIYN